MLVNFLNDKILLEDYHLSLLYRYSPLYEQGLQKAGFHPGITIRPVRGLYSFLFAYQWNSSFLRDFVLFMDSFILKYPFFLMNIMILVFAFKKNKMDLIHINNGGYPGAYSCQAAVIAARLCGVKKMIYVVNNLAVSYKKPARWLDYPIDRLVSRLVTRFVTGSQFAGRRLRQVLQLSDNKVMTIPNGIHIQAIVQARELCRSVLAISNHQRVAVVVAVLEARKGHIFLLEAMRLLKQQGKRLPLLLIEGVGSQFTALTQYVAVHDLQQNVRFLGTYSPVFDLLNAADFSILPSIEQEDFPNVILESMALGKAVIGSSVAGIPEQIVDGETGIVVRPRAVENLAMAIATLTDNTAVCQAYGKAAQARFFTYFTKETALATYRALYQSVIQT